MLPGRGSRIGVGGLELHLVNRRSLQHAHVPRGPLGRFRRRLRGAGLFFIEPSRSSSPLPFSLFALSASSFSRPLPSVVPEQVARPGVYVSTILLSSGLRITSWIVPSWLASVTLAAWSGVTNREIVLATIDFPDRPSLRPCRSRR